MKIKVAFPGTPPFALEAARAFHEADMLAGFVTTYHYRPEALFGRIAGLVGRVAGVDVTRELKRREIHELPHEVVKDYPVWEMLRVALAKAKAGPVMIDRIWDWGSHHFDHMVATRELNKIDAIYSYEYACLETFQTARRRGIGTIIDLPSPDSGFVEKLLAEEVSKFPTLARVGGAYFDRKLAPRLKRRREELRLADVIVANSAFTANSYVAAGVPAARVLTIPYGAPEIALAEPRAAPTGPLKVLWAGTFGVRKGAHYLLDAWRRLKPGGQAELHVYGATTLPEALTGDLDSSIRIQPTVPRSELAAIYKRADILVFPTLADGFGMVVTEAFAQGLPVMTTDRAGAIDLVRHKHNGLIVTPASAEAIVEAIEWCLTHRTELAAMREGARATAASWQWSDYRKALSQGIGARLMSLNASA